MIEAISSNNKIAYNAQRTNSPLGQNTPLQNNLYIADEMVISESPFKALLK